MITTILSILILISIGYISKLTGLLKKEHTLVVNNIITYFAMPSLIFRAVYRSDLSFSLLIIPLAANLIMLSCVGFAYLQARLLKLDKPLFGAFVLTSSIGNTGFLGYPLAIQLFGMHNFVRTIFYDLFGTVLFMFTVGLIVAEKFGSSNNRINVLKELLTFPPFVGLYVALVVHEIKLPILVTDTIDFLAGAAIPLIMISIGLALEVGEVKNYIRELSLVSFIKLVFSPLIALAFSFMLGMKSLDISITVLEASMPTFLFSLILGIRYGLDVKFIPSVVVVTTMVSMVTIPIWQYLLRYLI